MASEIKVYINGSEVEFNLLKDFNFEVEDVSDINRYLVVGYEDMNTASEALFNAQFKNNKDVFTLSSTIMNYLKRGELPYNNSYINSTKFILGKNLATNMNYPMALLMHPLRISNEITTIGTNTGGSGLSIVSSSTNYSIAYNSETNTITLNFIITLSSAIDINRIIMTRQFLDNFLASYTVNSTAMRYNNDDPNLVYVQLPIVPSGTVVDMQGADTAGLSPFTIDAYHFMSSDGSIYATRIIPTSPAQVSFLHVDSSLSGMVKANTVEFRTAPVIRKYNSNDAGYITTDSVPLSWSYSTSTGEYSKYGYAPCVTVVDDKLIYALYDTYGIVEYYKSTEDYHGNVTYDSHGILGGSATPIELFEHTSNGKVPYGSVDTSDLITSGFIENRTWNESSSNGKKNLVAHLIAPTLLCAYYKNGSEVYIAIRTASTLTFNNSFSWKDILVRHYIDNVLIDEHTCEDSNITYGSTVSESQTHICGMFFKVGGVMFLRVGSNGCVADTDITYYKRVNTWIINNDVLTQDSQYPRRHIEFTTLTPLTNSSQIQSKGAFGLVPLGGTAGENKFLHYDPVYNQYQVVELDTSTAPVMLDLILNNTVNTDTVTIDITIQPNEDLGGSENG